MPSTAAGTRKARRCARRCAATMEPPPQAEEAYDQMVADMCDAWKGPAR